MGTGGFTDRSVSRDNGAGLEHTFGSAQSIDQHNFCDLLHIHKHITNMIKHKIKVVTAPTVTFVPVPVLIISFILLGHLSSSEQIPGTQLYIPSQKKSFNIQILKPIGVYLSESILLQSIILNILD